MPNYKASNFWFSTISEMSSFFLDSTDEDGLVFGVGEGTTDWGLYAWRKSSTQAVDHTTIFPANGPGRWVRLMGGVETPPDETLPGLEDDTITPAWDTLTSGEWETITAAEWETL